MTVKTRTNVPAVSSDLTVIDGNAKYVAKAPTANLAAFAKFVADHESAPTLKNAGERKAFADGVVMAGLMSRFQADRRANKIGATVTFVEYALATTGYEPKNDHERAAVIAGISSHTLYRKYQISKRVAVEADSE